MRRCPLAPLALTAPLLLAACVAGDADDSLCSGWEDIPKGRIAASVETDGVEDLSGGTWEADTALYVDQGAAGLYVTVNRQDGYQLTMLLKTDVMGASVPEAVSAGAFPIEVRVGDTDVEGAYALVYDNAQPEANTFTTTEGYGEGTLTIANHGDGNDTLVGCFGFTARSVEDGVASVTFDGWFHLLELAT